VEKLLRATGKGCEIAADNNGRIRLEMPVIPVRKSLPMLCTSAVRRREKSPVIRCLTLCTSTVSIREKPVAIRCISCGNLVVSQFEFPNYPPNDTSESTLYNFNSSLIRSDAHPFWAISLLTAACVLF
jgi:hypothetical protein